MKCVKCGRDMPKIKSRKIDDLCYYCTWGVRL